MLYVGVDIIEIPRIASAVQRWGNRFLQRIYTPQELAFARGRTAQLAARFAAKEAVMKALGTGIRGVSWREIEVVRQRGQAPEVRLHGRAAVQGRQTWYECPRHLPLPFPRVRRSISSRFDQ